MTSFPARSPSTSRLASSTAALHRDTGCRGTRVSPWGALTSVPLCRVGAQPCPQSGSPPVGWDSQSSFHGEPTSRPLFAPQLHGCCLSSLFSPPPLPSFPMLPAGHGACGGSAHPRRPQGAWGCPAPPQGQGGQSPSLPPGAPGAVRPPHATSCKRRAAGCTDPAVPMLPPRLSRGCHCCPPLLFFPKVSPPLPWGCMRLAVEVWGS